MKDTVSDKAREDHCSMGSFFHRQGAAYRKERIGLVVFKEDGVGGQARVTTDEERGL